MSLIKAISQFDLVNGSAASLKCIVTQIAKYKQNYRKGKVVSFEQRTFCFFASASTFEIRRLPKAISSS